jgi:isopenicillin N synthase-like dioxygenase
LTIPTLDIAPFLSGGDRAVVQAWDAAMREYGFAIVSGHGIPEHLLNGVYAQAQDFFARPLEEKMRVCFGDMLSGQGYLPLGNETVGKARDAASRPDLCESLTFSGTPGGRANLWPDMPGFRDAVEAYMRAAERLAHDLMRLSAAALDLPEGYFDPFFTSMTSDLRCVLYPDQPDAPQEGQLRYGPHTDFSGFTILRQDDAPGGLEVQTRDGWIPVRPVPGTLVINAGDLIQRWTNDRWISNIHRVVNPPRVVLPPPSATHSRASGHRQRADARAGEAGLSTRRLSVVLFTGPNLDAVIETLPTCGPSKYPPIVTGDHVTQRVVATYGNLAKEKSR